MHETGSKSFRLLATVKCGSRGCGCPTVLDCDDGNVVVIGKLDSNVADVETVRQYVGAGEIAVTIPRNLLLQAAKSLMPA